LTSRLVVEYERARISPEEVISRSSIPECGDILLNRFLNTPDWVYWVNKSRTASKHVGMLLSGEKLVDDNQFKKNLFNDYKAGIGGDMEAFGLFVAAKRNHILEWIVIKGICDWGDGKKYIRKNYNQRIAAEAAVSLCECVLSSSSLDDLPRNAKRVASNDTMETTIKRTSRNGETSRDNSTKAADGVQENYDKLMTFAPVFVSFEGAGIIEVIIHAGPIDELTNIDVIVASENTHFDLARPFKPSTSGRLRKTAGAKDDKGNITKDIVLEELEQWRKNENNGNKVVPDGIVVPTSSGEMKKSGVERIYHAAIAEPIPGVHGYTTSAEIVEVASLNTIALLSDEQDKGIIPKPCSLCLPLFGAGRGKMDPIESFLAIISGISAGIKEFKPQLKTLHFITLEKKETVALIKALKKGLI
jgi:hypothetical protein